MANWDELKEMARGRGGSRYSLLVQSGPAPTQTTTRTWMDRADASGAYRTLAVADAEEAVGIHKADYMVWLRLRTADIAGAGGQRILADLADLGFAWRDIARMVGVSVPAIQKWRKGDRPSGENAFKLAQLLAGCEAIRRFNPVITDVALWFEVPVVSEAPITPIDLWASGNQQLVLEHARVGSDVDPYDTMNSFDPDWRERYRSDFETFVAGDGEISIRMRER